MKRLVNTLILLFIFFPLFAQVTTLKEKALDEYKNEHFDNAITLLEQAVKDSPNDYEIYYYLGLFNHYRASDSRPLIGHNFSYSQKILDYLDKAITLNPHFGDAKYFYATECEANGCTAMQHYDLEGLKHFYLLAFQKGSFPKWLLEIGRNMMNSCDRDAILFTGGDADLTVCTYLQLYEQFRPDITLIPIGFIGRPWHTKFLKDGLAGAVRKINLNLTDDQIMDMHPYKLDTTNVVIPFPKKMIKEYYLDNDYKMLFTVVPDLSSDRINIKIEGDREKRRTYLNPQRVILLQIIQDNFTERPIFFTNYADPFFYGGFEKYFQNCGMVSKLLPIKTDNTKYKMSVQKLEQLVKKENFMDYASIKTTDIPRISGMTFAYSSGFIFLANYYKAEHEDQKLHKINALFKESLMIGFMPDDEKKTLEVLEKK